MGPTDQFFHLAGFLAPALFLAIVLPGLSRLLLRKASPLIRFWPQVAVVFAASAGVLLAGLWWFGRDGKMATYGALVVAAATVQWLLVRGWR
jgi:hypothetical protein